MKVSTIIFIITLTFRKNSGEFSSESPTSTVASTTIESTDIYSDENYETITTTIIPIEQDDEKNDNNSTTQGEMFEPLPTPLASKLIRSYAPFTIVKHRTRLIKPRHRPKPRRRLKKPKPFYGPPNYIAPEPITYYKPQLEFSNFEADEILPTALKSTKFKYEEVINKKKPSTEYFDLDSEINIQSIPLNDFKQYMPPQSSYDFSKSPYYEKHPIPFDLYENSYISSEDSFSESPRRPNLKGKGKNKYQEYYVISKIPDDPKYQKTPDYGPPDTSYGIAAYEPIPNKEHYDVNSDVKSFAEPPVDYHYTYSTEYEISPPKSVKTKTYTGPKYLPPSDSHDTEYKVPSSNDDSSKLPVPHYVPEKPGHFAEPPAYQSQDSYAPVENSNLPLENQGKSTTYDYTKSSYEVPLYHPQENSDKILLQQNEEYYPPNYPEDYNNAEQINSLAKDTNKVEISVFKNFTKSSPRQNKYNQNSEINTSSTTYKQKESNNIHKITTLRPRRKRKRTRTPTPSTSTTKQMDHVLDVNELRDAFGVETEQNSYRILPPTSNFSPTPLEPLSNSRNKQNTKNIQFDTNFYHDTDNLDVDSSNLSVYTWEPIKTIKRSNPTTKPSINGSTMIASSSSSTTTTTESPVSFKRNHPPMPTKSIEIVSIQKSQSHSYYDGTISPEIFRNLNRGQNYPLRNLQDHTRNTGNIGSGRNFAILSSDYQVSGNIEQQQQQQLPDLNSPKSFRIKGSVFDDVNLRQINSKYEQLTKEVPLNHKTF